MRIYERSWTYAFSAFTGSEALKIFRGEELDIIVVLSITVPKNKPCKRVTHTAASRLGKQPNKATLRSDLDASCG